jgi:hypothetical protein
MSKNISDAASEILGGLEEVSVKRPPTKKDKDGFLIEEDSELDPIEDNSPKIVDTAVPRNTGLVSSDDLDIPKIITRLKKTDDLYLVKNDSGTDLMIDWDLNLLPDDMQDDFKKYLNAKYVQYDMQQLMGKGVFVSVFIDGQTINFLNSFMAERQIPSIIALRIGKNTELRSQLVLKAEEIGLFTAKQIESLQRYEKTRQEYSQEDGKESKFSDWAGFLIFKKVELGAGDKLSSKVLENLKECKKSFITKLEVMRTAAVVEHKRQTSREEPDVIRDTF